jgi:hypothetical protein
LQIALQNHWLLITVIPAIIKKMKETRARISEVFYTSEGPGARLNCSSPVHPTPGQYLPATAEHTSQILPIPLFPLSFENNSLIVTPPISPGWSPGMDLSLRGPLGNGFHFPAQSRHLLLADLTPHHGWRLLSLARSNPHPVETVLLTDSAPEDLPVEIEVLPLSAFSEILAWADYVAVELLLPQLSDLVNLAGLRSVSEFPPYCEALVDTPLICAGIASCGVCSVQVNHRWALACKDGPVFRLNQLSGEE